MDAQFVIAFVILALFIYSIIPWNCTENFTDTTKATPGCPSGGNLTNNSTMCSAQTTSLDTTTNKCPNGYDRVKNTCVRGPYPSVPSCPSGYRIKTVNGVKFCTEGFADTKSPTTGCPKGGNLFYNDSMCSSQTTVPDATNNCPNGFTRVNNTCVKGPYQSQLVCPTGYQLKTKNGIKYCMNQTIIFSPLAYM